MAASPQARVTPEEYLERDRAAEFRSEYYAGRIYPMSGGTWTHATLIHNLTVSLTGATRGKKCAVRSSDMRVRISANFYGYPDVLVICDEPRFEDARTDVVENPILIVEVLSPSTEAYDRGFKASHYRRMPSLRELVLVSRDEPRIEIFRRQPSDEWLLSESIGLDSTCRFESLPCSIPMSEIYDSVTFDPA